MRQLIEAARASGFEDREIAARLGVMLFTVRGWAEGTALPHALAQGGYKAQLKEMIAERSGDDGQNAVRVAKQATGED